MSKRTPCVPLPAPLCCPGVGGGLHSGHRLGAAGQSGAGHLLVAFSGPLVSGYSEGLWGVGEDWRCPGGSLPCRGGDVVGTGCPLVWGLPTLLCSHATSFSAPRELAGVG